MARELYTSYGPEIFSYAIVKSTEKCSNIATLHIERPRVKLSYSSSVHDTWYTCEVLLDAGGATGTIYVKQRLVLGDYALDNLRSGPRYPARSVDSIAAPLGFKFDLQLALYVEFWKTDTYFAAPPWKFDTIPGTLSRLAIRAPTVKDALAILGGIMRTKKPRHLAWLQIDIDPSKTYPRVGRPFDSPEFDKLVQLFADHGTRLDALVLSFHPVGEVIHEQSLGLASLQAILGRLAETQPGLQTLYIWVKEYDYASEPLSDLGALSVTPALERIKIECDTLSGCNLDLLYYLCRHTMPDTVISLWAPNPDRKERKKVSKEHMPRPPPWVF